MLENADDLGLQGLQTRRRRGGGCCCRDRLRPDRRHGRCGAALSAFDPVPRALETVGRQWNPPPLGRADLVPVDVDARAPERPQRLAQILGLGVGQARCHAAQGPAVDDLCRQAREVAARTDLQQERLVARHRGQRVGEAHRLAAVARPVSRIGRLRRTRPAARDAGGEGTLRRLQRDRSRGAFDGRQCGIERARMEGVADGERPAHHAARGKAGVQGIDVGLGPCGDHELRRVDGGKVERVAQLGAQLGFGQADRQHCARRHGLHRPRPLGNQTAAFLEGEDAAEARRDELADTVAHHGIGLEAPGHIEPRQRVLEDEEAGLRVERRVASRGLRVKEQSLQPVADERPRYGDALVDQPAEQRVVAMEVARHTGMLRALAGEHEHERWPSLGRGGGRE